MTGGEVAHETNSFIENIDDWKLHLADWRWERLIARQWPRWKIVRKDRKPNSLWKLNSAVLYSDIASLAPNFTKIMAEVTTEYGRSPDLSVARTLYRPPIPHEGLPNDENDHRVHRIRVNGVTVRYVEDMYSLQITVEGDLDDHVAETLAKDLLQKVSTLENCGYEMIRI